MRDKMFAEMNRSRCNFYHEDVLRKLYIPVYVRKFLLLPLHHCVRREREREWEKETKRERRNRFLAQTSILSFLLLEMNSSVLFGFCLKIEMHFTLFSLSPPDIISPFPFLFSSFFFPNFERDISSSRAGNETRRWDFRGFPLASSIQHFCKSMNMVFPFSRIFFQRMESKTNILPEIGRAPTVYLKRR